MGWSLVTTALTSRRAAALGATVIATLLLLSTTAFAFTVRNAGFTATGYASGFAVDGAGRGPRATAWQGNVLWSVDPVDGGLYKADAGAAGPGPLTSLVATRVGTVPGGVNGLAVGLDGRLYATLTTAQQVVELSATDGAIVRTLTDAPALPCPVSLATDPRTGDLFATSCVAVWRIASPATAPAVTRYARIADQNFPLTAITIGPDGTMFVVSPFGIYAIGSTASAPPAVQPISPLSGATGLAVVTDGASTVPSFLIVATADGAIFKVPGLGISSATTTLVLDGAGAGDQISVGPDRCAYASLGASVLRVADASGLCALARAGVALPTITLANTTGQDAHVDSAFQTIQAELTGSGVSDGTVVTFTVTGANPGVFLGTTVSGVASMSYRGHVVGTDTIVASATIGGFPITSAPLTLVWQRQIDLTPPTVAFSYTVPAGGTGVGFACPAVNSGMQTQVACGWFTKAPTIHWIVTANGSSGLGTLTNCQDYTLNYQPSSDGHHQICSAANGDGQASANLTVIINAILTPPAITANTTVNGLGYLAGTVTGGPVRLHFDCVSALFNGILTCPPDQTFSATGTYAGTAVATDVAGQQTGLDWGPVVVDRIDTTAPVTTATVTGAPDGSGGYLFSATVALTATDGGSGVDSIIYVIDGGLPMTVPGASTTFVIATEGTHLVTYHATDNAGNAEADRTIAVRVIFRQHTALAITSSPFVATGGAVSARLVTDGGTSIAGATINFIVDGVQRSAATDLSGIASVDLGLPAGTYTLTAAFDGTARYFSSSASAQSLTVYALTRFVVWGSNAVPGASVQIYGSDWAKQVADQTARKTFDHFKGYADTATGAVWTGRAGDKVNPPSTIARYVGVIVTTGATRSGDALTGNIARIVVLRVDGNGKKPYDGRVGDKVFATVVGAL